jgi:hypothetical protein
MERERMKPDSIAEVCFAIAALFLVLGIVFFGFAYLLYLLDTNLEDFAFVADCMRLFVFAGFIAYYGGLFGLLLIAYYGGLLEKVVSFSFCFWTLFPPLGSLSILLGVYADSSKPSGATNFIPELVNHQHFLVLAFLALAGTIYHLRKIEIARSE